jgi:putative SOS response-associated peptidase YedK
MCFTVNINLTRNELEKRFGTKFRDPGSYQSSYYLNAFDLPLLPVILSEDTESIDMVSWGLVPFWIKDAKAASEIRIKTLNARAETIQEKPSFRTAVKSKRCLVLVRGFYEWQHRGTEKIPYFIFLKNKEAMAIAGIYDDWTDRETGECIRSCSVITTAANPLMEKIHNSKKRMPVVLPKNSEQSWIEPGLSEEQVIKHLIPLDDSLMDAYTISKLISKRGAEKDVPELEMPFSYEDDMLW